jgi:hypothetical protein
MAVISPAPGDFEEVGRQLFSLTEDRVERRAIVLVQEGPGGTSFDVPDDLHDRWLDRFGPAREPTIRTSSEPALVRRGPGRPRKSLPSEQE